MIGSSENRISYNGNGIATEFAYTFKILEKSNLKVLHVAADGTEELLTTDYYVDMEKSVVLYPGYAPGAEIPEQNRPPILPAGERLVLYREVPITQESALDKHWPFNVIENGLDKLTIICQQIWDRLQRSFYVSESTSTNFDPKVPIEAGKTFRVKDDGTGFEMTEDPGKVIDGAKALLKLTTEQAEFAKEQADASSQSAVSAQNAANAAEAVAPEYKKTKEVLDNIVSYTNTATEQASIATTKASEATASAADASNSSIVATQKANEAKTYRDQTVMIADPQGEAYYGQITQNTDNIGKLTEEVKDRISKTDNIIQYIGNIEEYQYFVNTKNIEEYNDDFVLKSNGIKNILNELDSVNVDDFKLTNIVDWSNSSKLAIDTPQCAIVNISGVEKWPATKKDNLHVWVEFWDMKGNYFKKRALFNVQGADGSMQHPKKNGALDLCNDEWIGDDKFSLKIGEWVYQDSFHIKAYYSDYFRGVGVVSYQLMDEVLKTRGNKFDRPWKRGLINFNSVKSVGDSFGGIVGADLALDNGARTFPDGFPCVVYLNNKFYGIYSWQLKKHRDNMHQDKSMAEHIHLDGMINPSTLFNYNNSPNFQIDWAAFEVRNPKSLVCMDGTVYNYDKNLEEYKSSGSMYHAQMSHLELIDETSLQYNSNDKNHVRSARVKKYIKALSLYTYNIKQVKEKYYDNVYTENAAQKVREKISKYFDVDSIIDYMCVSDVICNRDGIAHNCQWTSYSKIDNSIDGVDEDGVKWFVNIYDTNGTFGCYDGGDRVFAPMTTHLNTDREYPYGWIYGFYSSVGNNKGLGTGELEARYKVLRECGIFTPNHIVGLFNKWVARIGTKNYELEFNKWDECPCNGDSVLNNGWELIDGMSETQTYNENTTYEIGSICSYGISADMGYYNFRAISVNKGVPPVAVWKYRDSIYRIEKWVTEEIANMDVVYNYKGLKGELL